MVTQVLTANRLRDGLVVFQGRDGWVESIDGATVAASEAEVKALDALGRQAEAVNEVVGAYLVEVATDAEGIRPTRYRELLRTRGPSVRLDLGPQASA